MDHLPKTQPVQNKKFGIETFGILGLFILGGVLFLMASSHHRDSLTAASQMQRNASLMAKFGKFTNPQYRVHLKTVSFDTFDKNKRFPVEGALVVDGKQIFAAKQPHFFDRFIDLTRGSHVVVIKMWDAQNKLTEKKYQVNVGMTPMKKVAQR